MLYGYVEGSFKAQTIETIGSHIVGKFEDEKQEDYINSKGGIIGGRIANLIIENNFDKIEFN